MDNRKDFNSQPMNASPKSTDKSSMTHKVGDAIERVGEKVKDMGATKVGNAIYRAGDKIEHSKDGKRNNK